MKAIDHVMSALTETKRISAQAQTTRADIRQAFSHFGHELQSALASATTKIGSAASSSGVATTSVSTSTSTPTNTVDSNALINTLIAQNMLPASATAVAASVAPAAAANTVGNGSVSTVTSNNAVVSPVPAASSTTTQSAAVSPANGTNAANTANSAAVANSNLIPNFKMVSEMTEDWSNPLWVAQHPEAKQDLTMSYIESTGSTVTPQQAQDAWEANNDKSAPDFKANAGRVFAAQQLAALTPQQRADWNRVQEATWAANHPSISS